MSTSMQQQIEQERARFLARVGEIALGHIGGNGGKAPEPTPETARALTWSPTLDCGRVDHAGALKAVATLNARCFQDQADWRLPEIRELLSLVDYTRVDPAIDIERFPDTKSAWYWTASSYAGYSVYAWIVHFHGGGAHWHYRYHGAFVRAVRGPVARARQ